MAQYREDREYANDDDDAVQSMRRGVSPGKATLTARIVPIMRQATSSQLPGHPGQTMDRATAGGAREVPHRAAMESAFGVDFGDVKAFTGRAAEMTDLNANAAARANTVVFADSQPSKELVAHELTHVVQHRAHGGASTQLSATVSRPGDAAEVQADQVAAGIGRGDFAAARAVSMGAARGAGVSFDLRSTTNERWDRAKTMIENRWERIADAQTTANQDWMTRASATDPPPIEQQILLSVLTAGIATVTGGIGGAIASHLTRGVTSMVAQSITRSSVEAGKQVINRSAAAAIGSGSSSGGTSNAADLYKEVADSTVNDVITAEGDQTGIELDALDDREDKWDVGQSMFDAIEATRHQAHTHQLNMMVDGWFSQLAQAAHGSNVNNPEEGLEQSTDERAVAHATEGGQPGFATSLVGVLGLHLGPRRGHPGENNTILYAEIDASEGNSERIRRTLLSRPIRSIAMPKHLVAEGMSPPGYFFAGTLGIGVDETNTWGAHSVMGASGSAVTNNGPRDDQSTERAETRQRERPSWRDDYDNGRIWLAQKALFKFERLSFEEVRDNWLAGATILVDSILDQTLQGNNITSIST